MEKPRKQGSSPHFVRQRLFSALAGKNRNFSYRKRRRVRYKSIKKQGNYDVPCKSSFTRDLRAPPSQSGSNRHRYSIPPGLALRQVRFYFTENVGICQEKAATGRIICTRGAWKFF